MATPPPPAAAAATPPATTHKGGKAMKAPLQLVPLDDWIDATRRLLELERDEEVALMQDELASLDDASNPNVLTHLRVTQSATALFGRTLLQLAFPSSHVQRPKAHQFTVGDLVQVRLQSSRSATAGNTATVGGGAYPTGIVARVDDSSIAVALSESDDVDEHELLASSHAITLDRLVNTATFTKLSNALDHLRARAFDHNAAHAAINVVFHGRIPTAGPLPTIKPLTTGLNKSQIDAIQYALATNDIALIHGPPGTGKTTTVVELIRQAVATQQSRVLVCAPSNIAVDNVLEKLAAAAPSLQLTRVGHPARLLPQVLRYCLDARIAAADGTAIVSDIRKEMSVMQTKLYRSRNKSERFDLRRELRANRKEIRQREQTVVRDLLAHSDVVFATTVGAATHLLKDVAFDLVVIDEAAQALEVACWVPMLKAKHRIVLAGDHRQLPPTIKSKAAAAGSTKGISGGLALTLFDRLTQFAHTKSVVKMLTTQYRMHASISDWSSLAMYNGKLLSADSVARRRLTDLPHVHIDASDNNDNDVELLNATLLLLDTAGCGLDEDAPESSSATGTGSTGTRSLSTSNTGEALIVAKHVRALLATGLQQSEVAVITPYNKQVQMLKSLLRESFPQLEIRSVDGFQGCEKEAVVMSLVRSNAAHVVGFLADDRRMNVAITRAKRHVAVVCDTETIRSHAFLRVLVEHFEARGEYRSAAHEYVDDDAVHGVADVASVAAVAAVVEAVKKPVKTTPSRGRSGGSDKNKTTKTPTGKQAEKASECTTDVEANALAVDKDGDEGVPTVSTGTTETEASASEIDASAAIDELEMKAEPPTASVSVFQLLSDDSSDENDSDNDNSTNEDKHSEAASTQSTNSLLKDLHLARLARQPAPSASSSNNSSSKKKNAKKKAKSKVKSQASATGTSSSNSGATAPVSSIRDGEDELAFLERQAKSSTKCAFQSAASQCKKSTTTMRSLCPFCKLTFCYEHGQPEVHGCGDAVRSFARTQFQQQHHRPAAGLTSASVAKPLTANKRKLLKQKLDASVTAKSIDRKTKAKDKKK